MRLMALALLVVSGAGCGSHRAAPSRYACDASRTVYLVCLEYGPLDALGLDEATTGCDAYGGSWGAGPCPTENLVASCSEAQGAGGRTCYYAGTPELSWLENVCGWGDDIWTTYP